MASHAPARTHIIRQASPIALAKSTAIGPKAKICSLEPMAEVRYGRSNGLPAMAGPSSILLPAKRIELVTKCAPGIGVAAWEEHVPSRLHTNVHERGLNFQIRFR